MIVDISFKPNASAQKKLAVYPDKLVYDIASATKDLTIPIIPRDSGKLRLSTQAFGIRGMNASYKIGSSTDYASAVWDFNDDTTHWTTPGTHSEWFMYLFKTKGKSIISGAIGRNSVLK